MADQTTETVNQQKQETITKQKNPLRVEQGKRLAEYYLCKKEELKEVPLHAPITWNIFQFKQKSMTNVACFHGQHFSCLESI